MLNLTERPLARRRPRGQPDTRGAILCAAEALMQQRGFGGFSYQHIAAQLGVRTAAIHYHFPSKDDLGVALVRRFRERFRDWACEVEQHCDAWQRLEAYFQTYLDHLEAAQCQLCPGGVLGAEFGTLSESMQVEARLLMREIYSWMVATLEEGRRDGVLRFDGDPYDKGMVVGAALQGGLQIARVSGPQRFRQLLGQLALELTGRKPDSGPLP